MQFSRWRFPISTWAPTREGVKSRTQLWKGSRLVELFILTKWHFRDLRGDVKLIWHIWSWRPWAERWFGKSLEIQKVTGIDYSTVRLHGRWVENPSKHINIARYSFHPFRVKHINFFLLSEAVLRFHYEKEKRLLVRKNYCPIKLFILENLWLACLPVFFLVLRGGGGL